jgi:hypothetical protein
VASVSYDDPHVLAAFAKRTGITFPMLSDPQSAFIRAFGMVDPDNTTNNVPADGKRDTAYPGYFVLDRAGRIVERFIDPSYDDRRTASGLVAEMFPELLEATGRTTSTPHLNVQTGQSDLRVPLGARFRVFVDIELPKSMHVYAPGVEGYRPVTIELAPSPWFKAQAPLFPPSTLLRLEAIKETVPVYHGKARVGVDVVMANTSALLKRLSAADGHSEEIAVIGTLSYQACDDKVCYRPSSVAVKWELTAYLPDRQRTPK